MAAKKLESYVVEVSPPRPAEAGVVAAGPAYRAAIYKEAPLPCKKTIYDLFSDSVEKFGGLPCIGSRQGNTYTYLTYKQTAHRAAELASAMVHVGVKAYNRVAIFGANCVEWMLAMQACNRNCFYCVPLYDSLGDQSVDYIIQHSEASIVLVSARKVGVLAQALPKVLALLKNVVVWGQLGEETAPHTQAIRDLGIPLHAFDDFLQLGLNNPAAAFPPRSEDICTIMYTSGTTGTPKGVLLTHRAVASEVVSQAFWFEANDIKIGPGDIYLSFLPLAHIYDRAVEEVMLYQGASIAYWSGAVKGLPGDIKACQPTIFCSVPRVYERMYAGVMEKLKHAGMVSRLLYNWAFNRKLAALKAGYAHHSAAPLADRLVLRGVSRTLFGGRMRFICSGGAPLSKHVEEFMRVVGCCVFVQGYGLTETCASSFINQPDEPDHFYSVGPPQPVLHMRLEAVPEMDYDPMGSPPRGEVLIKGDALFSGYYKNEEETRKALDSEGWFHTGDVGELMATGSLRIIDRKKNIFKLSQGEYIAVEKIEGVLMQSPFVEQIWVHGSHFESSLVAVVVPAKEKLQAWADANGVKGDDADVCSSDAVREMLLKELDGTGKKGGLKGFELVKGIHVEPQAFSVENDLLTPTFKLRRPQLLKRYKVEVDAMYQAIKAKAAQATAGQVQWPAGPTAAH